MHILVLTASYPNPNGNRLQGIFVKEQVQALRRYISDIQVAIPNWIPITRLTVSTEGISKLGQVSCSVEGGVDVYRYYNLTLWKKIPILRDMLLENTAQKLFSTYVERHGMPDLIHAHFALWGGVIAERIKKKHSIPYVVTVHSSKYAKNLYTRQELLWAQKALHSADARIAVGRGLVDDIESRVEVELGSFEIVPNVVSNQFVSHAKIVSDQFCFLNVANLNENKAHKDLLRAFAAQFRGRSTIELRIGGSGPLHNELKSLAVALNISEQVEFLGSLNRADVVEEMNRADAFVLSSHYETFGVVLIEALACGLPVISTRCGGPEDIVHDLNGILVPPSNVEELGVAMKEMTQNVENYNSEMIRQDCLARFGEEAVAGRLISIYKQVSQ